MNIIRNLDYYASFIPLRISINDEYVGKLTAMDNKMTLDRKDGQDRLEFRLGLLKGTVVVEGDAMVIVEHPRLMTVLFYLSVAALFLHIVSPGMNDFLYYGSLVPPALYLLSMLYFNIFNRNGFLKIRAIRR